MKIYFAGSIRGGRLLVDSYKRLIEFLKEENHQILTDYVGDPSIGPEGEKKSDDYMYERDVELLTESDVVIAETSITSIGVGWEIGYAQAKGKKIICLHNVNSDKKVTPMISGNSGINLILYTTIRDAKEQLKKVLG